MVSKFFVLGSEADMSQYRSDARFTPESGHSALQAECPLWDVTIGERQYI
jgi:hypothetical protein